MKDYCLFIPYVNRPDLLARAVASVCELGPWIINNSASAPASDGGSLVLPSVPLTFSQSMNFGIHHAKSCGLKFCFFLHSDAEAAPGVGLQLLHGARQASERWGAIFTNYDAFVVFNVEACHAVGDWDVHLPWYFADNDFYRRLRLAGYPTLESNLEVHHEPSQTLRADAQLSFVNRVVFPLHRQYYAAKWGGEPGRERWDKPFDGQIPE